MSRCSRTAALYGREACMVLGRIALFDGKRDRSHTLRTQSVDVSLRLLIRSEAVAARPVDFCKGPDALAPVRFVKVLEKFDGNQWRLSTYGQYVIMT
ncbi:hypothetical protein BV96_04704 [Sphingomonas paucimobilis]|nr:hypothetical protein BV96_04704 [Sphingomonas paucimobilis]